MANTTRPGPHLWLDVLGLLIAVSGAVVLMYACVHS
jgi:hypothetical protein